MRTAGSRTVKVCGQELRVEVRPGTGAGTPLLMCGGIGISYEVFDLMVEALDPGIDIIRVDVPGVGGSPAPIWPYGFPELARLLVALLDELEYRQVDVLGFSWGGALAQQFAVQYRGRCRRLVLICTSTGWPSIPGRPHVVGKMLTPKRFRGADHTAGLLYGGDIGSHGDDVRRLFRDSQVGSTGLGYFFQLVAAASWTSLPFLGLIRQPVLVMGGDADPIVPVANARVLAGLIPNATLHVFAGGHVEPLAAARDFGPLVNRFLLPEQPTHRAAGRPTPS